MQLKEEVRLKITPNVFVYHVSLYFAMLFLFQYRTYESLRREHDSQIVEIAMKAGLRITPETWSTQLYGNTNRKSEMQSIIDKVGVVFSLWCC